MDLHSLTYYITDISEYLMLLVGGIGLVLYPKADKRTRLVFLFLALSGVIRMVSIYFASNYVNTHPFYHLLGLVELLFVLIVYRDFYPWKYPTIVSIGLLSAYVANSIFFRPIWEMNNLSAAGVQLVVLISSILYLRKVYLGAEQLNVLESPFYKINFGFLFYAGTSLFVLLMSWKITMSETPSKLQATWIIEPIVSICRSLIILYAVKNLKNG